MIISMMTKKPEKKKKTLENDKKKCYILCVFFCSSEAKMNGLDVFTARNLRNNSGEFIKDAEEGRLSIITKHGAPIIIAVPFDSQLLNLGVNKSLALHLFEKKVVTLSQAAKIAKLSIDDFLEILKTTDIDVVDYPENELEMDLKNIS